ncbi:hypothetical protein PoB_006887200 [Plakobranchus ocellatus]|uniref:Uncharacterized protein n=1 Tax=Plakobranchus ocellatus TaxID=259542 RepID=A0AAV4DEA3_9GAST|nr:hypothetical protein PoB_006887200 [Plakobranchus ocellatus]
MLLCLRAKGLGQSLNGRKTDCIIIAEKSSYPKYDLVGKAQTAEEINVDILKKINAFKKCSHFILLCKETIQKEAKNIESIEGACRMMRKFVGCVSDTCKCGTQMLKITTVICETFLFSTQVLQMAEEILREKKINCPKTAKKEVITQTAKKKLITKTAEKELISCSKTNGLQECKRSFDTNSKKAHGFPAHCKDLYHRFHCISNNCNLTPSSVDEIRQALSKEFTMWGVSCDVGTGKLSMQRSGHGFTPIMLSITLQLVFG